MTSDPTPQQKRRRADFRRLYETEAEPWTYSARAAEVLRHDYIERTVRRLHPGGGRLLDVGCSVGQLTSRLAGLADEVVGMDVSATAAARARARCAEAPGRRPDGRPTHFVFCLGSSSDPPFRGEGFDLILMCDGLHSWGLTADEQARSLARVHQLLRPGGHVILTDHMKPAHFASLVGRIRESPLEVVSVRYLHNRLWYSVERGLRPLRGSGAARRLLASRGVARVLMALSRLAGRRGAKHLCVVARRSAKGAPRG